MTQGTPHLPLGKRVLEAREQAKLTQDELAYRVRVILPEGRRPGGSVISRIEHGKIARPEPYVIAAIASVCGVSLLELAPEYVEEAAMIQAVLAACAPRDSNPESAEQVLVAA